MKKIHRKVIRLQARKFDKLLKWVNHVASPFYPQEYVKNFNTVMFPNGVNPNSVSRSSKWLPANVKARIIRKDISKHGELNSPLYTFKDAIMFQITGIDAQQRRYQYDIYQ